MQAYARGRDGDEVEARMLMPAKIINKTTPHHTSLTSCLPAGLP